MRMIVEQNNEMVDLFFDETMYVNEKQTNFKQKIFEIENKYKMKPLTHELISKIESELNYLIQRIYSEGYLFDKTCTWLEGNPDFIKLKTKGE